MEKGRKTSQPQGRKELVIHLRGLYPRKSKREGRNLLFLTRNELEVRDALIGKRLSLDLTFPIGFDCGKKFTQTDSIYGYLEGGKTISFIRIKGFVCRLTHSGKKD